MIIIMMMMMMMVFVKGWSPGEGTGEEGQELEELGWATVLQGPSELPSMADKLAEWSPVVSNVLLCAVSLSSAIQTAQVNRGVAAGFLLQALAAGLVAASTLSPGLWPDVDPQAGAWVATVIGFPLLAFGFHWVNGDRSTANLLLGGGMVLAASGDHFSPESRAVVAQSVALVASVTILIVSVFTANAYGVVGSVAMGASGLMARLEGGRLLGIRKENVICWVLALGSWAYRWALQMQHQELD
ncbi:cysteine and histidine-rich protein 1 isoform X1 [Ornithorhynchus anatinus]|uniref:cysteine and histidine-rich protein 1 isoform X1 n=1 Tax=Ornithorhynchus anatinus TaxID=9258 RepID=UPI0010A89762|nr:cysteine and histidine-rich protein 1 isoform X1 [Ornithorhynchus anatinus]